MHQEVKYIIEKGLGLLPSILLAIFTALFGIVMIIIAPPTDKAIFYYAFGVFCLSITLVTITKGRLREFFASLIGSTVFAIACWYIYSEMTTGQFISGRRSGPSIINSILLLIVFGLPGIYYVIKAKFGFHKCNEEKLP